MNEICEIEEALKERAECAEESEAKSPTKTEEKEAVNAEEEREGEENAGRWADETAPDARERLLSGQLCE